jgi:asparagine synthase (glutamine-hydrolysing)
MCGISGIWRFGGAPREKLEAEALAMARSIRHRGPDDEGIFVDERAGVAFGFRRLSILDLTPTGHQPMSTPDGRFTLELNGEIYNFAELRDDLERAGLRFRGTSDTEVLLHAFATWGVEPALKRAAGMFALALWDARERRLVLARDRLGKKPLYVGRFRSEAGGELLLFGSELKALAAHGGFARELDRSALAAYFRFGYVPAPQAIFRGVKKLVPTVRSRKVLARPKRISMMPKVLLRIKSKLLEVISHVY